MPAPKQRNTDGEKAAIKAGKTAREIWPDDPNTAAQKDTSARWTLKIGGKVRHRPDGTPLPMIAVPVFGYKSHTAIDRRFGFIREGAVTSASAADGRMLRRLVSTDNTSSDVRADSAYRARSDEKWLAATTIAASRRASRCRRRRRGPMARSPPSGPDRARLRASEDPLRPPYPDDRPGTCRGQADAGQPRLQHRPPDLP